MRHLSLLFLAPLLALAGSAAALAPTTVSYQGSLEDGGGNPINAAVNLTFTIYNDPIAGAAANIKWTETHAGVTVTDGLFSVTLGSINPLFDSVFNQPDRWLGIKVGTDPEITPRTKFTSVAYSDRTHTIDGAKGGTVSGGIAVGDFANSGELAIYSAGIGGLAVYQSGYSGIGEIGVSPSAGGPGGYMAGDFDGTGGYLSIEKGTGGSPALLVDGNSGGSGDPIISMDGSASTITFQPGQSGDASVLLPNSSIDNFELENEPGVAYGNETDFVNFTGSSTTLLSRTILCPTSGYVLAIASASVYTNHTNGVRSDARFGVSDDTVFPENSQNTSVLEFDAAAPTGFYSGSAVSSAVFTVGSGNKTIYVLGYESSGQCGAQDINLTLVFFSTGYGLVSTPAPLDPENDPDALSTGRGSLTAVEIEAEQRATVAYTQERLQGELDDMKARFERLEQELAANRQQRTVANPNR